jgi:hypothetical protein
VAEVVAHVVAAERQHRERVPPQLADRAGAAAVVSDDTEAPRKVPCCQLNASVTSGTAVARRPPNRIAEIGTPFGSSHSGAIVGHCPAAW